MASFVALLALTGLGVAGILNASMVFCVAGGGIRACGLAWAVLVSFWIPLSLLVLGFFKTKVISGLRLLYALAFSAFSIATLASPARSVQITGPALWIMVLALIAALSLALSESKALTKKRPPANES